MMFGSDAHADQENASSADTGLSDGFRSSGLEEKDLRRYRRVDLLELLVEQGREFERVRGELASAREELRNKDIAISNCGSIAEASLELSHVFEAAQAAADQYLGNVKRHACGCASSVAEKDAVGIGAGISADIGADTAVGIAADTAVDEESFGGESFSDGSFDLGPKIAGPRELGVGPVCDRRAAWRSIYR